MILASMLTQPHVLLEILFRTLTVYFVVLVGVRLTGKREVGMMTPFDLVLLLLLSNSVQNAMTGPDNSLVGGVVAASTLLLLNFFIAERAGVNRKFRRFVQGQPSLLIHDGQPISAHMAHEHVSHDELMRALREHGVANVSDVSIAVLEVDGSISVLKYDDVKPGHAPHERRKVFKKPE